MKDLDLSGLIAAPFTPMYENGEVNYTLFDKYVQLLMDQDVYNVYVNGTTGEGPSLTIDERKRLVEKWVQAGKGKLKNIMVQVGTACLKDTVDLTKHAAEAGADVIATLPPFYFKPNSVERLVDYLAEVGQAAPDLPLFYYHIPSITGVAFEVHKLLDEAVKRIPNFKGIKYTGFDLFDFGRCVMKHGGNLVMGYGKDEQLCFALLSGADAAVGSTFNYCGKLYSRMFDACKKDGDYQTAVKLQQKSQQFIGVMFDHGFDVDVNKAVMKMVTGLDVGPSRLPLAKKVPQEKMQSIKSGLENIGFFEFRK